MIFTLTQTVRGWDVAATDGPDCIYPITSYPNAYKAAARLLQLMEITNPINPQDWPESIGLGSVDLGPPQ